MIPSSSRYGASIIFPLRQNDEIEFVPNSICKKSSREAIDFFGREVAWCLDLKYGVKSKGAVKAPIERTVAMQHVDAQWMNVYSPSFVLSELDEYSGKCQSTCTRCSIQYIIFGRNRRFLSFSIAVLLRNRQLKWINYGVQMKPQVSFDIVAMTVSKT